MDGETSLASLVIVVLRAVRAAKLKGCAGLPWWPSGEESACQSGDAGSFPGPGRARMAPSRRARQPQLPPVPEPTGPNSCS